MKNKALGSLLSVAGMSALSAIVAFAINILSARALGPELRGEVATVLQLSYILAPLIILGSDKALLRGEAKPKGLSSEESFGIPPLSGMLFLATMVSVALSPLFGLGALFAGGIALIIGLLAMNRANAIRARSLTNFYIATGGYQSTLLISAFVLMTFRVADSRWWIAIYLLPGLFFAWYAWSHVKRVRDNRNWTTANVVRSNQTIVISSLGELTITRLGRVLLPIMSGPAALGLYIVVATATEPLYWLGSAVADFRSKRSRRPGVQKNALVVKELLFSGMIFAGLGIIGGVLLNLLLVPIFGPEFSLALSLVVPLTIASIILAIFRHASGLLLASDRPKRTGLVNGVAAGVSLLLYPVAIHFRGMLGAAWSSVAIYLFGLVLCLSLYPWNRLTRAEMSQA